MATKRQSVWAHVLLVLVTLVWGTSFALVKMALRDSTPLAFNLVRFVLAFAILLAVNFRAVRGTSKRDLMFGSVAGFFLGLGYQLQTAGLVYTTAAKSAILTGLVVVFVPLLTVFPALRTAKTRKPGAMVFMGAVVAFVGLVLLTTPPGSGLALLSGLGPGEWLTLGCALAYAGHLLVLDRAATTMPARRLGTLQIGFCALTMVVTLPVGGHPAIRFTHVVEFALVVTAVLATAAAFTIQSWAQQHLPATHTALIFTMEPVFAWIFGLMVLHERMGERSLVGAGLILAGILAAEFAPALRDPPQGGPTLRERGAVLPTGEYE